MAVKDKLMTVGEGLMIFHKNYSDGDDNCDLQGVQEFLGSKMGDKNKSEPATAFCSLSLDALKRLDEKR